MQRKSWVSINLNFWLVLFTVSILGSCASAPDTSLEPSPERSPMESPAMSPSPTSLPGKSDDNLKVLKNGDNKSSKKSTPLPGKSDDNLSADEAIHEALANLPKGDLYYSVPPKMKVQQESIIEAVLTPKINQQIQEEFKNKAFSQLAKGVKYSGSGVEMRLLARKEDFDILLLNVKEKQRIFEDTPGRWRWSVKPLQQGKRIIVLQALVYLGNPKGKEQETSSYEVFSKEIPVESNPSYSFTQFLTTNWDKLIGLVFGSGTLGGLVAWWLGQRKNKVKSLPGRQDEEAVAGRK
jgi:hypothetical protein